MSIIAVCTRCKAKLKAPDAAAGRTLSCPKCGDSVTVPSSTRARTKTAVPIPLPPAVTKPPPNNDDDSLLAQQDSELPLMVTDYIAQNLMPGERLIAVSRIHPMVLLAPDIMAAFGLLITLVGIVVGDVGIVLAIIGVPVVLIAGVGAFILFIDRITTEFSCTDRRILIKSGVLTTQLREMPLGKAEALLMQQGLFGKLFGYGTLVFKVAVEHEGAVRTWSRRLTSTDEFRNKLQLPKNISYLRVQDAKAASG